MKRFEFPIDLIGPSGDKERWVVKSEPLKADDGLANWIDRKLLLNSRMRNPLNIFLTLMHEIAHVTGGQNLSEEFCVNFEHNVKTVCDHIGLKVDSEVF